MRVYYETAKKKFDTKYRPTPPEIIYKQEYPRTVKSIITCFKERVEDGWYFNGEYHNYWEMIYVTKGSIFVSIEGETLKLEKNSLVFFMPMEFHQMWCEDCPEAKFIVISFLGNNEVLEPLKRTVITPNTEEQGELQHIYDLIHEAFDVNLNVYTKPESVRNTIDERLCYNKMEYFLLILLNSKISDEQKHLRIGNMNYKHIVDTMVENINKNLTIEELASLCNMSVSNLKKTFSKYGNDGVMKYFNQLKINRAIWFLKEGRRISTIAYKMGFSSPNYFSVVFKRETGMLPSEFKKKNL